MNIPNYVEAQFVDEKGMLTPIWKNLLILLLQQLQNNVSNNGYVLPQLTTLQIANLTSLVGNLIYNSDTQTFMVNIAGVYKTVTAT
jgi:hypothetical protein